MCLGHTYNLACGHSLLQFSERCERKCAVPTGESTYIQDTCAPCDPSFRVEQIIRAYDQKIRQAQEEHRIALQHKKHGEIRAAYERVEKLFTDQRKEVAEVRKLGAACPEVIWPGKAVDEC
ncbi:hypothetical protein B0T19DRAFT_444004 [Cercophora scortea]|uniref:Uncharacterized protein n=1 Tax=Cercophora scortea TaxID=314031 RepID=A0AAE0IGE0_9PEZI|nr:hypothetical protein B0T19DRAFT_444004 [Cercophora scortea]